MTTVPNVEIITRVDGEFLPLMTETLFENKLSVLFSLPGAFTPTCTAYQLPGFEEMYDEFSSYGVDEIYCISVNDSFVMNAWAEKLNIKNVKMIPDGNAEFTQSMGMLVEKTNLGFGSRSWRYAAVIQDKNIIWKAEEEGKADNVNVDPYVETTPEKVLEYIKNTFSKQ